MQIEEKLKYCKRCGITFNCNAKNIVACQCSTVSISQQTKNYLSTTNYNCLRANCLSQLNKLVLSNPHRLAPSPNDFIEEKHFYKENQTQLSLLNIEAGFIY